jgi:hypothetical protein
MNKLCKNIYPSRNFSTNARKKKEKSHITGFRQALRESY